MGYLHPRGFVHGRSLIRAADFVRTRILGNYLYDYHRTPVTCDGMPWIESTFIPGHMHTECDANLWSQVETLVRQYMDAPASSLRPIPSFRKSALRPAVQSAALVPENFRLW